MSHDTYQKPFPTCPHCGHQMDNDEMQYGKPTCEEDLYALAPNEGHAVIKCPLCDKQYVVLGGYAPHYTSFFSMDEI